MHNRLLFSGYVAPLAAYDFRLSADAGRYTCVRRRQRIRIYTFFRGKASICPFCVLSLAAGSLPVNFVRGGAARLGDPPCGGDNVFFSSSASVNTRFYRKNQSNWVHLFHKRSLLSGNCLFSSQIPRLKFFFDLPHASGTRSSLPYHFPLTVLHSPRRLSLRGGRVVVDKSSARLVFFFSVGVLPAEKKSLYT